MTSQGYVMKKITLGLLLILAASVGLAGCNTMAGFGKDVQDAGQSIHKSAEKHKPDGD